MSLHILPLAGLGFAAAYLLGQSKRQTVGPPPPANNGTSTLTTGNLLVGFKTPVMPLDVAGDVQESEVDALQQNPGLQTQTSAGDFFRHVWLPASLVPISSLTSYDYRMAVALLSGGLHRRADLEPLYQRFIVDEQGKGTGVAAAGVVSAIASIIPIVGSVVARGIASEGAQVAAGVAGDLASANGDINALRTTVNLANLDPPAQMLLAPVWQGDGINSGIGDKPMDFSVEPWVAEAGVVAYPPVGINGIIPQKYFDQMPFRPRDAQLRFCAHRRLFTLFQYGMMLPWVSDELIADKTAGTTLRQAINQRARVFRVLDIICCLAYPDNNVLNRANLTDDTNPLAAGNWTAGWYLKNKGQGQSDPIYYYVNPTVGGMYGSIFPPTAEDKHIVDSDGFPRDFQGNRLYDALTANLGPQPVTQVTGPVSLSTLGTILKPIVPATPAPVLKAPVLTGGTLVGTTFGGPLHPITAPAPAPSGGDLANSGVIIT